MHDTNARLAKDFAWSVCGRALALQHPTNGDLMSAHSFIEDIVKELWVAEDITCDCEADAFYAFGDKDAIIRLELWLRHNFRWETLEHECRPVYDSSSEED